MSKLDDIRAEAVKKIELPYISPEVYSWLRILIGTGTNYMENAGLEYYIGQNVRGIILMAISEAYNAPSQK